MSDTTTNPPAFPQTEWVQYSKPDKAEGMTLRDYFAAKALQGIIASDTRTYPHAIDAANMAYEYADAMLAKRKAIK